MATSLSTTLTLILKGDYQNAIDLSTVKDSMSISLGDTLATGTGANQADMIWHDRRTVTAAAEDLDLAGVLTSTLTGAVLTFVTIKGILIHNRSTTATQSLSVGGDAVAAFINWVGNATDIVKVGPDGTLLLWSPIDGYAVTATTGDLLQIDPGANTIIYDIVLIGTSA